MGGGKPLSDLTELALPVAYGADLWGHKPILLLGFAFRAIQNKLA
jgi:hypothetical protein